MLCAFANGVDGRVKCLHNVIHNDATFTVQAGAFCQCCVRYNADTHDDKVGCNFGAVLEAHTLYAAVTDNLFGGCFHQEGHAAFFK